MARYFLTHDGQSHYVDIDESPSERGLRVVLDGQEHFVDACSLPGDLMHLLVDGMSYDVDFERASSASADAPGAQLNVRVHNAVVGVEVLDERQHNMRELGGSAAGLSGAQTLTSPMPGKVVKLLVAKGDSVSAGQGLVVVEAMKMENELQSTIDGVVTEFSAVAGQAVEAGAVLVVVEPN